MKHEISQDKLQTKFQLQLEKSEKAIWQEYADIHHRGNLARMIRTIVNHVILESEMDNNADQKNKLDDIIENILNSSVKTSDKVDSFENDLTIIKSLLSKLLQSQSQFVMEYQNSVSLPLEDIVYQRTFEYVQSQERIVTVEELIPYLIETSVECKRFIAVEDQKLPAGGKIALAFILEDVMKDLYRETRNEVFNTDINPQEDFARSKYEF